MDLQNGSALSMFALNFKAVQVKSSFDSLLSTPITLHFLFYNCH